LLYRYIWLSSSSTTSVPIGTPRFIHLTNSSVQKARGSDASSLPPFLRFDTPTAAASSAGRPAAPGGHNDGASTGLPPLDGGSKCSLGTLRELLARQGVDWGPVWERVEEVVLVALFAAQDAIPHCINAFELFGFDVMIDRWVGVREGWREGMADYWH